MGARVKICVVTPRFAISGVALMQHRFARALAARGHQVDLIIGRVDSHIKVPDAPGVNIIALDVPKVRHMAGPLWRYLRQAKPDVIFSAEDHLNALMLAIAVLARSKAKISGSSRVTPFDTYSNVRFSKRWWLKQFMRLMFRRADVLTCVSQGMVDEYNQVFSSPRHVCVYNLVDDGSAHELMAEPLDEPWLTAMDQPVIVAAGTLAPWKGFADLIEAMAIIARRGRKVRLIIVGEGPLHADLQAQAERLGIGDRVKLPGFTVNPMRYFARADVFALPSLVEGFGNVLVEAMIAGCTPVAADCPTGPREILDGGRYGYLVPVGDAAALAAAIDRALDQPINPDLLAEGVRRFTTNAIVERHFELLGIAEGAR